MPAADQMVIDNINRLASEHHHERDQAMAWLEDHPNESLGRLRQLARSTDLAPATLGAIHLLGRIGDDSDVKILEPLLHHSASSFVWAAAQALGSHPSKMAETVLLRALSGGDNESAGAAAIALGMRGAEAARKPLEDLLRRGNESLRYRAVLALDKLGSVPSVATLRSHLAEEQSADVRRAIENVLNKREP